VGSPPKDQAQPFPALQGIARGDPRGGHAVMRHPLSRRDVEQKRHGRAEELVADKLRPYGAACQELGI
jgi:hypothetical protein